MEYSLSYAGVPFFSDGATAAHVQSFVDRAAPAVVPKVMAAWQACHALDEIEQLLPQRYLQEYAMPPGFPGRKLSQLARTPAPDGGADSDHLRVGEWYYPNTARRWSIFRGLMTSNMVKEVLRLTGGSQAAEFVMKCVPTTPDNQLAETYTITTDLYMLPPRPLGETGGNFDGLYLVTLVDERFHWQNYPATLTITPDSTWESLTATLATLLGVTITFDPAVDVRAARPEPDSQLWCHGESAAVLLDALAFNVGACVVREFDGSYKIMDPLQSRTRALLSRGNALRVLRHAGGDLFTSGTLLPVGNLTKARNAIVPAAIDVHFPNYIIGDDPVPHSVNPRYPQARPSTHFEESRPGGFTFRVPVVSGGSTVSGLSGVGIHSLHTTAKALCSGETQARSGQEPINISGLRALAFFLAKDRYDSLAAIALDEVYPGTYSWTPEGVHDIVWTYSERLGGARTRLVRTEWNNLPTEFQHNAPISGIMRPKGVGGPSVAQTWRDTFRSGWQADMAAGLTSSSMSVQVVDSSGMPQDHRWKGLVDNEVILLEGFSGGNTAGVVFRGIDGTNAEAHAGGVVTEIQPHSVYGANLIKAEEPLRVAPGAWTSGGITEAVIYLRSGLFGDDVSGCCACASGQQTICASGYPAPLPYNSGNQPSSGYVLVSGYPYPLPWGIGYPLYYIVYSGYPYPLASGPCVVVSGCFPYPLCSGVYTMTSGWPYPLTSNVYYFLPGHPYPIISGGIYGTDIHTYAHAGEGVYYYGGQITCAATGGFEDNTPIDKYRIYAVPLWASRGGTLDTLAAQFSNTDSSGALARIGLYATRSVSDIRPSFLLQDSGDIDISGGGVKTVAITQGLVAGALYWLAVLTGSGGSLTTQALTVINTDDLFPILGTSGPFNDVAFQVGWYASNGFGALPSIFPSGAVGLSGPAPAIGYKFAT